MCAKPTGFLEYERRDSPKRPVAERLRDYREILVLPGEAELSEQAARCMDCGIPFCHSQGCPLGNLIPDFNDMVYGGHWQRALELLHRTNNFPEITGRICPAPCEASCTLNLNQEAVTIRQLELAIVEKGWREGWIVPVRSSCASGRRVAVVGSGPAGLAAAQQLVRAGHQVTVFERDQRIGGILRYGIPDFKLEKWVLDRRLRQLQEEGVTFETEVDVGSDLSINYLRKSFDAILLAGGARTPRDLRVPGRELRGIYPAMEFLTRQNRTLSSPASPAADLSARDRKVVIIGGGDTGADCLGTCLRQGAREVVQIEILPKPPPIRDPATPWPEWPRMLRCGSSHEEGGRRRWSILTKAFVGSGDQVEALQCVQVSWSEDPAAVPPFEECPGTDFTLSADMVLLAMGFTQEGNAAVLRRFDVEVDAGGRPILDDQGMSTTPGLFVAGDLASGASLVVQAIACGRSVAEGVDRYLTG